MSELEKTGREAAEIGCRFGCRFCVKLVANFASSLSPPPPCLTSTSSRRGSGGKPRRPEGPEPSRMTAVLLPTGGGIWGRERGESRMPLPWEWSHCDGLSLGWSRYPLCLFCEFGAYRSAASGVATGCGSVRGLVPTWDFVGEI